MRVPGEAGAVFAPGGWESGGGAEGPRSLDMSLMLPPPQYRYATKPLVRVKRRALVAPAAAQKEQNWSGIMQVSQTQAHSEHRCCQLAQLDLGDDVS